jgi:ABC-type branched-subunit amino acid transport system substrate-binding protein
MNMVDSYNPGCRALCMPQRHVPHMAAGAAFQDHLFVTEPVLIQRRALLALPLALASPTLKAQAQPIRLALIEGLSGPFANAGEAVFRNLLWAVERVNQRGGVRLPGGARPLELLRFDSKGTPKRP